MDNTAEFVNFVKRYLVKDQNNTIGLALDPKVREVADYRFLQGQINASMVFQNILDAGLKSFLNGDKELTPPKSPDPEAENEQPAPYSDVSASSYETQSVGA
jgi:hypothetical protein